MNFMENIGKKIRNKKTGEIMVVNSVGEGIHVTLTEENKRENWMGFMVGSPVSEEWEIYEEEKKTLSDNRILLLKCHCGFIAFDCVKHSCSKTNVDPMSWEQVMFYPEDKNKQSLKEFVDWVTTPEAPSNNPKERLMNKAKEIFGERLI